MTTTATTAQHTFHPLILLHVVTAVSTYTHTHIEAINGNTRPSPHTPNTLTSPCPYKSTLSVAQHNGRSWQRHTHAHTQIRTWQWGWVSVSVCVVLCDVNTVQWVWVQPDSLCDRGLDTDLGVMAHALVTQTGIGVVALTS